MPLSSLPAAIPHLDPAAPESARHWERLGFRTDPYYGLHLPVDPLSLALFVGRADDRTRLRKFLEAYPTGMTLIEGPPGVGKTSLVNVVQHELFAATRRFPCVDVVETTSEMTRESFLLAVLSVAVSSARTAFGEAGLADDAAYQRARQAVTRTLEYASSMNLTGGVPKLITAGVTRAPVATTPLATTPQALLDLLRDLVSALVDRGFEGVLVPVNNLDTLEDDAVVALLNLIRDVCSAVDGVHWIFIGGAGLFDLLEVRARRVSERFTSNPIALDPLGWPEVRAALEVRRRAFALAAETPLPISLRVSELVHAAGGGELRFTFTRLSRTVLEFAVQYPSEQHLPDELAMSLLRAWGTRKLARKRLSPREAAVTERLLTDGSLRPRDYAAIGFQTSQRLSQVLASLVAKGRAHRVLAAAGGGRYEFRPSPALVLAHASSTFAPPGPALLR